MNSLLHVIFAFIFHFIATASALATDNIRFKAGIVVLQFIFLMYQIFVLTRKTSNNVK